VFLVGSSHTSLSFLQRATPLGKPVMRSNSKRFRQIHNYFMGGLDCIEYCGLLVIAFATTVAMANEVLFMFRNNAVTLADLLLMFLYLEVLAMVGVYFRTGKLPVRFPIYIAIVALARYLLVEIKSIADERMLALSFSIFLLGAAVLIIRLGHTKYPYINEQEDGS
jgi:protein PsiE